SGYARCIMYAGNDGGVYVFPCLSHEDGSANGDYWFLSVEDAESACQESFGILPGDWIIVDDPLPDCLHDWLAPVRIKGRDQGTPKWGQFERLEGDKWVDFVPKQFSPEVARDR